MRARFIAVMLARVSRTASLQVVQDRDRLLATRGHVQEWHVAKECELRAVVVEVRQLALRAASVAKLGRTPALRGSQARDLTEYVVAHEERVAARAVAGHQRVSLALGEEGKRRQRGTPIELAVVLLRAYEHWVVGDR